MDETIYLKADKVAKVSDKKVFMRDIVKLYGTDKKSVRELNNMTVMNIKSQKKCKLCVSVLKIIELIHRNNPELAVQNIGESDFIVEYTPAGKSKKLLELVKAVLVCVTIFIGAAFTIMTFNEDVSVRDIFSMLYEMVGAGTGENGWLEIGYSIGLALGICIFFNHFARIKMDSDPTPLQVQLRLYEENTAKAIIKNAEREGKIEESE